VTVWRESTLANEVELAYGKGLPAHSRRPGTVGVYGSNGLVGLHDEALIDGPGIVVGRKGTVGAVTYSADAFWPIDTTYYVVKKGDLNWRYLFHLLSSVGMTGLNSHSAIPGLNREDVYSIAVRIPPLGVQDEIASALDFVSSAIELEGAALGTAEELLRATTTELLYRGLHGEPDKDTEIGQLPASWTVSRLDECADVISTRMTYSQLEGRAASAESDAVRVLGIKVSDMNRPGNEVELIDAALEVDIDLEVAKRQCAAPGTIIFPKRGAAIATNKKRLGPTWTVFDPNVIGVRARPGLDQRFLFHWFRAFDLRSITEPGPTPQLNKKNLDPLLIPVPAEIEEQREIVSILDALERKTDTHRQRRLVLEELFETLLHQLISGDIGVEDLDTLLLPDVQAPHKESA
jgi:type I restriction enzyme S subunit